MRAVGLLGDHQADEMPAPHRDLVENSIGAATVSGTATRCHSRLSCSRCAALLPSVVPLGPWSLS